MNAKLLVPSLLAVSLLTACGSTPPSPEEQAMANQMKQAFLAKIQGMSLPVAAQQQQQQQAAPQPEIVISATELTAQKQKIDETGGAAIFYRK